MRSPRNIMMKKEKSESSQAKQKYKCKIHLPKYLKELERITHLNPMRIEESLLSIETTNALPKPDRSVYKKYEIEFSDKSKLRRYFDNLIKAKDGSAFLLTEYSKFCGALPLNSINDFNLDFSFNAEHMGIIVLMLSDNSNELVLDFYEENNVQMLEIEAFGNEWSSAGF